MKAGKATSNTVSWFQLTLSATIACFKYEWNKLFLIFQWDWVIHDFKWKYNVGNSHGYDFVTGEYCLGCGPQEQFYGCSDISITTGGSGAVTQAPTTAQPGQAIVALWGQCGGEGYTGSTNCGVGNQCLYQSQWYSQCVPKK